MKKTTEKAVKSTAPKTGKKTAKTAKVSTRKESAPEVESEVVIPFSDYWKLPVTNGASLTKKLASVTEKVNNGMGRLPRAFFLEARDANPRGTDVSTLLPRQMSPKQYDNLVSIAEIGVSEPAGVLISDRPEHLQFLSEAAKADQMEVFGFNFILLVASGNFRLRAIDLHCNIDKSEFKGSGVRGIKDPLKIPVPFTIWNAENDLTYLQIVGRAAASNTQQEMSLREQKFIIQQAIEGNKSNASDRVLAKSLNMSAQVFSSMKMLVSYTGFGKWLANKDTGAIGATINTLQDVRNYCGSQAKEELKAQYKGKSIPADEAQAVRDRKFQGLLNKFNQFMDDASRTIKIGDEVQTVRDYLRGKATKCFTKEQVGAILGLPLGKADKIKEAAESLGLIIPEKAVQVAAQKEAAKVSKNPNDGLSGLVPSMTAGEESVFAGTSTKIRRASTQFYALMNLLIEKQAITKEQYALIEICYSGAASGKGAERILAENIEKFGHELNLSKDQIEFAEKHGWIAPTEALNNLVASEAPQLLEALTPVEEAEVIED